MQIFICFHDYHYYYYYFQRSSFIYQFSHVLSQFYYILISLLFSQEYFIQVYIVRQLGIRCCLLCQLVSQLVSQLARQILFSQSVRCFCCLILDSQISSELFSRLFVLLCFCSVRCFIELNVFIFVQLFGICIFDRKVLCLYWVFFFADFIIACFITCNIFFWFIVQASLCLLLVYGDFIINLIIILLLIIYLSDTKRLNYLSFIFFVYMGSE